MNYRAPRWLWGGHVQTIWPALFSRHHHLPQRCREPLSYRRERWTTPDDDFIDLDWLDGPPGAPLLVLFHGLEGNSRSHYARAFAAYARDHGLNYVVPHFRGCSGEINRAPRAYHSGDHEEVGWILGRLAQRHPASRLMAVGVSLGGNALMRWAQEAGVQARSVARAVAAISSPLDLAASGRAIGAGFNKQVYTRRFLATMKPKALLKLQQHPGLFDARALQQATDLHAFDQVFTAPLHGFRSADDYWRRASARPGLHRIRLPALLVNALNDPFVPADSLPRAADVGPWVTLWQPRHGGHVGFAQGRWPGHLGALPEVVAPWLMRGEGPRG